MYHQWNDLTELHQNEVRLLLIFIVPCALFLLFCHALKDWILLSLFIEILLGYFKSRNFKLNECLKQKTKTDDLGSWE